ncbi:MAG: hypothetical protein D6729_14090, partial [Deltaproteobacteria bacterium]
LSSAQFSTAPQPWASWAAPLDVTLPAGSSEVTVYYRDEEVGSGDVTADAGSGWLPATAQVAVSELILEANAEPGTVLRFDDSPPGAFGALDRQGQNTAVAEMEAAHRGAFGYRVTDVESAPGSGVEVGLRHASMRLAPPIYFVRAWVRLTNSNRMGNVHLFTTSDRLAEVALDGSTGSLALAGFDAAGSYTSVSEGRTLPVGEWHLLEVALTGLRSANGTREAYLDGQPIATAQAGIDWTGFAVDAFSVGLPWSNDRTFIGAVDVDDLRAAARRLPSRLTIQSEQPIVPGACTPLTIELVESSAGMPVAPLYDVDVALGADDPAVGYFADPDCNQTTLTTVTIPQRSTSATVYVRASAGATLSATHPDFLGGTATVGSAALDPASPVSGPVSALACASQGEFAHLIVDPRSSGGQPYPASSVTVDPIPPFIVAGASMPDGSGRWIVEVGSDRCDSQPRSVTLRVNGITLSTRPEITFLCPEVTEGGISAVASPAEVPADGRSESVVTVRAVDRCGNPAFDRPVALRPAGGFPATVSPEAGARTRSEVGAPDDGTAEFRVTSEVAGTADFDVEVDGTTVRIPGLVVFTLSEALAVSVTPVSTLVVPGQDARFQVRIRNEGDEPVSVRAVTLAEGLLVRTFDDAPLPVDLGVLEPGEEVAGTVHAVVRPDAAMARLQAGAEIRMPSGTAAGTRWSPWAEVPVLEEGVGCACSPAAGGGGPLGWLSVGLVFLLFAWRRRA